MADHRNVRRARNPDPLFAAIGHRIARRKRRLNELAAGGGAGVFRDRDGLGMVLVSIEPGDRSKWRATSFDNDGEPTGHSTRATLRAALEAAWERGADVFAGPVTP